MDVNSPEFVDAVKEVLLSTYEHHPQKTVRFKAQKILDAMTAFEEELQAQNLAEAKEIEESLIAQGGEQAEVEAKVVEGAFESQELDPGGQPISGSTEAAKV